MKSIHIVEENCSGYKNRWKTKQSILGRTIDFRSRGALKNVYSNRFSSLEVGEE